MIINPVFFLVGLYALANLFALCEGLDFGGFYFYDKFFQITTFSYFVAFAVQLVFLLLVIHVWKRWKWAITCNGYQISVKNICVWILVAAQLLTIIFVIYTGAGKAGSDFKFDTPNFWNYILILIKPDLLVLIVSPFIASNRGFALVMFMYCISLMLRGWMGALYFLAILVAIRCYPFRITSKHLPKALLIFIFLIAFLPVIEGLKWAMRGDFDPLVFFSNLQDNYGLDLYATVFKYVIARFSHLNNLALIIQENEFISAAYDANQFRALFSGGILYESICRLSDACLPELGTFLAVNFYDSSGSWNADPGFFSWLFIDSLHGVVLLFFFYIILSCFFLFFGKRFGARGSLLYLAFTLIYLFHGWYSAFLDFLMYYICVYFILRKCRLFIYKRSPIISVE